jgi:hypothetical protein
MQAQRESDHHCYHPKSTQTPPPRKSKPKYPCPASNNPTHRQPHAVTTTKPVHHPCRASPSSSHHRMAVTLTTEILHRACTSSPPSRKHHPQPQIYAIRPPQCHHRSLLSATPKSIVRPPIRRAVLSMRYQSLSMFSPLAHHL